MADLHLLSPGGFRAAAVYAGIKSKPTPDVALLVNDSARASAAAVFTLNRVVAAPVIVGREHVCQNPVRAIVVNAGNANACTGKRGLADARKMCQLAAGAIGGIDAGEVLPSSTGIIGRHLPMEKIARGISGAAAALGSSADHARQFAAAILTTDLVPKSAAASIKLGKQTVIIAGVCKGSGMIGPRMGPPQATMLAYLTTNAALPARQLQRLFTAACDASFNAVTVDDHTSTNDTAVILSSGLVKISPTELKKFSAALSEVCQSLAYQIAADGEGATKVVKIEVTGAASDSDARAIARTIANSPLVKTAMHGNDPNWGRIVSAAGYAGVPFDPDRAVLTLQKTAVFRRGQPLAFDDATVSESLKANEVRVQLNCNLGRSSATCWTCDLSREYITINADYHT